MNDIFTENTNADELFELLKIKLIDLCERNSNIKEYQAFKKQIEKVSSFDELMSGDR